MTVRWPQPLGVFPPPAGFLVVPGDHPDVVAALMAGSVPELPGSLAFIGHALAGDTEAALASTDGDDETDAYNRFVLQPDLANLSVIPPGPLRTLGEIVAYSAGLVPRPPDEAPPELAVVWRAARATHLLEHGDLDGALRLFGEASAMAADVSKVQAAQLEVVATDAARSVRGADRTMIDRYRAALAVLDTTDLAGDRAGVALSLAVTHHELGAGGNRSDLLEAARNYQLALGHYTLDTDADLYAFCHNNLALTYLAMPLVEASDQLRAGIAIQSLRAALEVYPPGSSEWASTQLNLANALVYLPSSHPRQNLADAVDAYELLLAHRDPETDPVGHARVLANQGQALAHLGILSHAREKLVTAKVLLEDAGEHAMAATVADAITDIGGSDDGAP